MSKIKLTFVTGNANKLKEAQKILSGGSIEIVNHKLDLPELQGEVEDVAREKAKLASQMLGGPVLIEDTSLGFDALKGLPGVYIKWFLEKLGLDGLNQLLAGFENKDAKALCTFAYTPGPLAEPIVFQGVCEGTIVPPRGPANFGWDPIFQPKGHNLTYAEMPDELKHTLSHGYKALLKLKEYFENL